MRAGEEREPNAVGKMEDRQSGGGRGRKRGFARNLGVAGGCPFLMMKTPVSHTQKGTPFGGGNSCGRHASRRRTWWAKTDCKTPLKFLGVP